MRFSCPSCNLHLQAEPELAGKAVKCPGCGTKIQIPEDLGASESLHPQASSDVPPPDGATSPAGSVPAPDASHDYEPSAAEEMADEFYEQLPELNIKHVERVDNSNVNIWLAAAIGAAFAFAVILGMMLIPADSTGALGYLRELFLERGWPQYATTFLTGWTIGILLLKSFNLRKQRRAMMVEALPRDIGDEISIHNLPDFYEHVVNFPKPLRRTFIISRIRKALEFFYVRQNNPEVAQLLTSQSEIDANQVAGSYSIAKVFLWAIPIMGFIGTVLGIGAAVGQFGDVLKAAGEMDALQAALTTVLGSLGVAFDTTLLALVFSIILAIPVAFLQRSEEDHINEVDEYCIDNLLKRLNDGGAGSNITGDSALVKALGDAVAASAKEMIGKIQEVQKKMDSSLDNQNKYFKEVASAVDTQLSAIGQRAEAYETKLDEEFFGTLEKIRTGSVEAIEKNVKPLSEGIHNLNDVLRELNGKQVKVQKRGWFSR